jgi:predicted DNA-binding protein with PD1-like motif
MVKSTVLCSAEDYKGTARTHILVLDRGEEVMTTIARFADEQGVQTASFTAIGAFESALVAYFDAEQDRYLDIPVDEQVEVLSLTGNLARSATGRPLLHAHAVLARRDGSARGGHLKRALVRPTLEVVLIQTPAKLVRHYDESSGLALIDLDAAVSGVA